MVGLRPVVNLMASSFAYLAWSQLVNEAANAHYLSNGQSRVPAVFYAIYGERGGAGVQHSASPQSMLTNVAGLEVLLPSTPRNSYRAMKAEVGPFGRHQAACKLARSLN